MDEEYVSREVEYAAELYRIKTSQEALINCSMDLIWSIDRDFKLISCNNAYRDRVHVLTKDALLEGQSVLYTEFGEEINKKWARHYADALKGNRFTIKEELFNTATGRMEYGQITFNPMYNADGKLFGVACYSKNITDDILNLVALENAKDELQKIMDSSLDMICVIDEHNRIVKISAASVLILGYRPEELTGKSLFDLIYPDDKEQTVKIAARVMAGENLTHVENRYVRKDGSIVPLIWSAHWNAKDRLRYGVARDATEKKKSEEALVASERIFRYLFEQNPFPIAIWDFETLQIVDCNDAACEKYGYTRSEFLALTIKELRRPEDIPLIEQAVKTEGTYGEHHKKTWRHKKKNGVLMYVEVTGHLMDYKGKRVSLAMINDITESYYYQELDKLEKNVLKLNAEHDKNISHIIETYLAGIGMLHPGMLGSVQERKGDMLFNLAAAPALPRPFLETKNGIPIADNGDACGTAAFLKQKVIVSDISTGDRWKDARVIEENYDLKTCWSYPILDQNNEVIATFAVYFHEIRSPMEHEENTLLRTVQFLRLILESYVKERALKISNERFAYAAEATSDIIWDWNLETNDVYYSQNIEKLFGHNKSGLNQDNLPFYFEHVHPEDRERVVLYPDLVRTSNMVTWSQEYRFKKANGQYAIVLDKGIVIRDENGVGKRMIGAIQDITTLRKQNERLHEIAQINAHEIRRPVATILGLMQLFALEPAGSESTVNLLSHLEVATLELDEVIRRIIVKTDSSV
jgi:PAS domain S-box-containing protein